MKGKQRRTLLRHIRAFHPDLDDPIGAIAERRVRVAGRIVVNPAALVERDAPIVVTAPRELRGSAKLRAAISAFDITVAGCVALDLGAAAGGFTTVLIESAARCVYAVDVGHGQLLGSLRQDARVVNLERTNLARLDRRLIPDDVDVVTMDLSYLSVARALGQLQGVVFAGGADLVALVKPMFELGLATAPEDDDLVDEAGRRAWEGASAAGWQPVQLIRSPVEGAKRARELFLHAIRATSTPSTPPS